MEGLPRNAVVIVNLINPKEKFWGFLLDLNAVGLTLRGINIDSFEDWVRQVAKGADAEQTLDLVTMFVPLFRVERMFLDEAVGDVPAYSDFFREHVGATPHDHLGFRIER